MKSVKRGKKKATLKRSTRFTPMEIAMILCLTAAVAYTIYLIFAKFNPYSMNSDFANDIIYRRLSWEQKTLFPKGYVAGLESLSTRPVLLYWLFYAITHKFLLAFQLENVCTFFLELAAIYYFLTKLKLARSGKLFALFLMVVCLTPSIMAMNFWPLNASVLDVISVFLTLGIRISLQGEENIRKRAGLIGIILILAAILGYGTIKEILFLYLPLVVLDVGRMLFRYLKRAPIQRVDRTLCAVSVVSLCINILSYALFLFRHSDVILAPSITIAGIDKWLSWETLSSQLQSILLCFGIAGGGKIASLKGILFMLSVLVTGGEALSILWLLRNGSKQVKEFLGYWAIATVGTIAYHVLRGALSVIRYYSMVAIPIYLLCGCAISEWMGKGKKPDVKPLAAMAAVVALFLGVRVAVEAKTYTGTPPLAQVAAYAEENGYQYAVGSYWNAGVLTGYTDGYLETWYVEDTTKMTTRQWLIDTNLFTQERLGERGLMILTDSEEQKILEDDSYAAILLNDYAEKVTEIDVYNLYTVTENPCTLIEKIKRDRTGGLPAADQTEKTDLPGNEGFRFASNAALNENGELVSDGVTAGTILYGPYSETIPGVYDITLNYTMEAAGAAEGIFDVALDTLRYAAVAIPADQTSVTLEDVSLEAGHKFEARVIVPAGMVIRVQSIHYTRVG